MTDHIIKAAQEAGFANQYPTGPMLEVFERFYAIAFKAGMERAAEICDGLKEKTLAAQRPTQLDDLTNTQIRMVAHLGHGNCASAIRAEAHAQNQPENEHDGSDVSKN